ncbi:MAG: peptidoglycan binding domain-containing protein, partial [Eubacteriales bacterium]|nr:peptidoglycan binding domain-containing protein [Eubacteriales bacterium]
MADETKMTINEDNAGNGGWKKKINNKTIRIFLIVSACVLVVALAASAVFLLGTQDRVVRVMDYGTVLEGVSVGGVDISGMTGETAREATAGITDDLLSGVKFSIDINTEAYEFSAEDLGIYTDYEEVLAQALMYGHTGTFDERKAAVDAAKEGIDFAVDICADEQSVSAALLALKEELDAEPKDATYTFMPDGYYLIDGVAYDAVEDIGLLEDQGIDVEGLELVQLAEEDYPNPLRYQYYQDTKFIDDYIPKDAYIARFYYTEEVTGLIIDIDAVRAEIISAVESDNFQAAITAPVEVTEATVTLEQIKAQTQLISSWTSSYRSHSGANRNFNVAKMSGIINGVEIAPGVEWSINEEAGPRTYANGWLGAAGINGGAYVTEP